MRSLTQAPPRRRMAAADRREAILAAALDAFATGGYHETSLEDVAERAGISKALIYEHFPSKRDLFGALLDTYVGELMHRVVGTITAAEPGEERLRAGIESFLAFVEERREAWRMLVRNVSDPEIAAALERLRHEVAGSITVLMAEEAPPELYTGVGREQAITLVAEQIVGAVQALANWWDENREVPRERLLEIAMDFMWLGMDRLGEGRRWSR
ncbi:MAG TPA: TetR/AcrR family transcriptional regulator [Solirubrobacterales bacterium]|nr:TetR/AcrR family transcriptional regulator [Solirubrobacterales bacterium]